MQKTLQIFSTITYFYSLLAVCGTHGSCVVVLPYDWHNIDVGVFEMKRICPSRVSYILFAISAISCSFFNGAKRQKISAMRNIPLIKLTCFRQKPLQIVSTIVFSYPRLAVWGTHVSCVVVLPYDWHNIDVDTLFSWQFFTFRRHTGKFSE